LIAERADTTRFELTHDGIAQMIGAPRSAVSQSAAVLRKQRIIDYRRGMLTIRNAEKLRKASCECFEAVALPFGHNGSSSPSIP
jgi:hypothetical protein